MKTNTSRLLKRAERFQVLLIGEGLIVGGIAGFVVLLYRMALEYAGVWMHQILDAAKGRPLWMAGWFAVLALLAWIVGKLVAFEPMISGSGIPQLEGEMVGKLSQKWYRVIPAKFLGGFLSIFGGLALGREGPSIQLGAMVGQAISKGLYRGKTEEKFLLTCGASAGLAAAFHAPLAGVMFSLEEVHKNFSASVLVSAMTSALTADFLCSTVTGTDTVFQFEILQVLPPEHYALIVGLGVILGVFGAGYNWFTLKVQSWYRSIGPAGQTGKLLIPFLCAGVLGFTAPELLGTGHSLIEELTNTQMTMGAILFLLVGRFLFSAVSFGSGAPGGIFFPLLVIGGLTGGAYAQAAIQLLGMDPVYMNNFVLLAMAGYFAAIVRAPLTGIILIFEMTGSLSQMLSLSIVSVTAYITATLLHSRPIYESLLERLLARGEGQEAYVHGQKVLLEYVVEKGSALDGARIADVEWPKGCLIVAVQRGAKELIPRGKTTLQMGDVLVAMTDEELQAGMNEHLEGLCSQISMYTQASGVLYNEDRGQEQPEKSRR